MTADHRPTSRASPAELAGPFNLGVDICQRWAADRGRLALYYDDADGQTAAYSFWDIQREANRLANVMAALGTLARDRVAIVLPQCPQALIAQVAIYQMGAIAAPLAESLAARAIAHRLADSAAHLAIVDSALVSRLLPFRRDLPHLRHVISVGGSAGDGVHSWERVCAHASPRYTPPPTAAGDPALLLYPDDAADPPPEAVLFAHAALLDALDGYAAAHDSFPQAGDMVWSPIDWASTTGLWNVILPTLHFGIPLLASRPVGDARKTFALLERYAIRNTVLPAQTLAAMMNAVPDPRSAYDLDLRTLVCAGEPPGQSIVCWAREELGVTIRQTCPPGGRRAVCPVDDLPNTLPHEHG